MVWFDNIVPCEIHSAVGKNVCFCVRDWVGEMLQGVEGHHGMLGGVVFGEEQEGVLLVGVEAVMEQELRLSQVIHSFLQVLNKLWVA